MASVDPVLVALIAVILLFVFVVFLFVRRTVTAFTSGVREGHRED